MWFNVFGLADLVVALTLGVLTGYGRLTVTPSGAPITELPLALAPTVGVPLLFALQLTSLVTPVRARRPAQSVPGRVRDPRPRIAVTPARAR